MSIEQRLREGLTRNAADVLTPLEGNLETVLQRHRRRVRVKVALSVVAAALVAWVPWVAVTWMEEPVVTPVTPDARSLAGTYELDVDGGRGTRAMAGTWVVTLTAEGVIQLEPPAGFDGPPPEDGTTFVIRNSELTTNAFIGWPGCQRSDPPLGRYRVDLSATGLTFVLVEDTCPARLQLFDTRWERLP